MLTTHELSRNREYARRWRAANAERVKEQSVERNRRYRQRHPQKARAVWERYKNSPLGQRTLATRSRARLYRLSLEQYDAMVIASLGRCGICGHLADNSNRWGLVVDHCHETGRVRGLICGVCNRALVFIESHRMTQDWIASAYAYLGAQ